MPRVLTPKFFIKKSISALLEQIKSTVANQCLRWVNLSHALPSWPYAMTQFLKIAENLKARHGYPLQDVNLLPLNIILKK
jgi:hypothetical protein